MKTTLYVLPDRQRLRALREQNRVTTDEVAEASGIPRGSLSGLFSPTASDRVSVDMLAAVADVFGVEVDEVSASEPGIRAGRGRPARPPTPDYTPRPPEIATPVPNKLADALAALDDARNALSNVRAYVQQQGAATLAGAHYRELVRLFSDKPLTHAEALAALREVVHDAGKWRRYTAMMKELTND